MALNVDFTKLKTSWTKYDIVQVMDVISSEDRLDRYKKKKINIDEPILRSFLGISKLSDPTPNWCIAIQDYPNAKNAFAFLVVLFTHGAMVKLFADKYSYGDKTGVFTTEKGKQFTNLRSALVESGVAEAKYRKTEKVPFDFSYIFATPEVGKLFKEVLIERVFRLAKTKFTEEEFYQVCFLNQFHKALSLSKDEFTKWLEGASLRSHGKAFDEWIEEVEINNFFSVEDVLLDFNGSKEVYLLGENGDGKSLILIAIYLAFNGNYILSNTDLEQTGKAVDILRTNSKTRLLGIDQTSREYGPTASNYLQNLFAYGTHRGRYSTDTPEEYGFMTLFDSDKTLTNPVSWLKDQKLLELEKKLDSINMIPENKRLPYSFSVEFLERVLFDLLERNVQIKIGGEGVIFIEKGVSLSFDQLSEGYKSILIFVSDLLYRLSKNVKDGESIYDIKASVLVDEIDLHLHPKWQKVIIGKLRKIFPKVQFIFTTHSPTIILGASEEAIIFRVYRNADDGKTRVSEPYLRKNLDHLMINSLITSPLFGLDDARMNPEDEDSDTSDTYLLYKINEKIKKELKKQKEQGKEFVSDEEIDELIQKIMNNELKANDKN